MKKPITIALCQMTSIDDWGKNIQQALKLAEQAVQSGTVDLICYPENSLYMRLDKKQKIPAISIEDSKLDELESFAKKNNCYIYLGSLPLIVNGKTHNSTVIISPEGKRSSPYQKIHLFDIELQGQEPIRESDDFTHGLEPSVIDIKGWKLGLSICYDLRFSELYSKYQKLGVDIIGIPSAFLVKTGQAHWHTLVRARAIESQCFVIAAAQSGSHANQRETYGHSLVVDPWGTIISEIESGVGVKKVTLDHSLIETVRKQIPMQSHRRI